MQFINFFNFFTSDFCFVLFRTSPTGDAPDTGFSREGFGRQSMSEKRKGHIDPRMSEFYQKVKGLRDSKGKDQPYASGEKHTSKNTVKGIVKLIRIQNLVYNIYT